MVRIVIDVGLRRQLIYDPKRHISCLVSTWISQASAKQRQGRTGRVFEGVCIRLFTKSFYDNDMPEFDPPEMLTAPLDKLFVNVKHLSGKLPDDDKLGRKRTPKELIRMVAQPPEEDALSYAVDSLSELGALS